jgi:hypothetical protein
MCRSISACEVLHRSSRLTSQSPAHSDCFASRMRNVFKLVVEVSGGCSTKGRRTLRKNCRNRRRGVLSGSVAKSLSDSVAKSVTIYSRPCEEPTTGQVVSMANPILYRFQSENKGKQRGANDWQTESSSVRFSGQSYHLAFTSRPMIRPTLSDRNRR